MGFLTFSHLGWNYSISGGRGRGGAFYVYRTWCIIIPSTFFDLTVVKSCACGVRFSLTNLCQSRFVMIKNAFCVNRFLTLVLIFNREIFWESGYVNQDLMLFQVETSHSQSWCLRCFMMFKTFVSRTFHMSATFTSYGGCKGKHPNHTDQKIFPPPCAIWPSN